MSKDTEVNVVIWSGGWDSTLVLDRLCSANPDRLVWAHSINWDMLAHEKVTKEKVARKNYLKYAKAKGYNISHRTITVSADMGGQALGYAQGLAWISFMIPYLPMNSIVHLGYYNADGFWEYEDKFNKYVKAAGKIGEKKIELKYPLRYMSKCDIIEEVKSRHIPMSCIWTCENPKGKKIIHACGKCRPCRKLKTAEYESSLNKAVRG